MITEEQAKEGLRVFFTRRGFAPLQERLDHEPEGAEVFVKGRDSVAVYTLSEGMLVCRNSIIRTLVDASANLKKFNQTYIALPKMLASIIDISNIEPYGMGALIYDKGGVMEVLPPRYFDNNIAHTGSADTNVSDELKELRSQVDSLKRTLKMLAAELEDLRTDREKVPHETISVEEPSIPFEKVGESEGLPAFIRDNPWVTVLSRRGRE